MSRRGFWLGLLVGMIVMGLLAATVGMFVFHFRRTGVATMPFRGRMFELNPRDRTPDLRMPGLPSGTTLPRRSPGLALLLCIPGGLLILGALVLAAIAGRHFWHRSARHGQCCSEHGSEAPAAEPDERPPQ